MRAETKFIFFPDNNAPSLVRAAAAVYWIAFLVFSVRIAVGVGVPPFSTPQEVEGALTAFGLFSAITIFYVFTIMRLSAGKLWARNVALFLTALLIVTTLYHLFSDGLSSEQNNVVGLLTIAAETVAGLFLLTSESTSWFKSKIH
ncbi:hypothetical protein [Paraburkholderia bryophila]|uniref:Uncharacterized protein n=1 Tax=Paraburkholderia bryophila TaxID=420952 RepID=A0A7Y9WUX9_9BURK|nr:hypothetical protein [Paraburkholderia bryophila]NYH27242.1 hypothetical protein [Paraburkholderia bryophila]